jgi:L-ascorbate metabolism protein UlaG (beta-lactamase superfamily)/SAM-dependent methyltransferase
MATDNHPPGLRPTICALILILAALGPAAPLPVHAGAATDWPAFKPGEATVWYLGHCGYAVKTRSKLLVFDYTGDFKPRVQPPAEPALANGWISPQEIKDLDVVVFVSHDHSDHYDPVIRSWAKTVRKIHYVFGWDAGAGPNVHSLAGPRGTAVLDGVEVFTVNDHHDTVPEVAFLVRVDGVTIYFNGDYYGKMGRNMPSTIVEDMRFLKSKSQTVDLAFILASASDTYNQIVRSLAPKAVFPMHAPANGESMYATYAADVKKAGIDALVFVPDRPGSRVEVRNGKIESTGSQATDEVRALWLECLAWVKAAKGGASLQDYAAKLERDGVPAAEVQRRLQVIRTQFTEQPEGIELIYDSTYGKPLTGDPKKDGFKTAPNSFLVEAAGGLKPGGKALDVGAGMGRNAIHLASLGWNVTAIDLSGEGLKVLQANAAKAGLKVDTVKTSYQDYDFGKSKWDLVAMILSWAPIEDPAFLARVKASIKSGGHVIFESNLQRAVNPFPPGVHAPQAGALRELFKDFEILTYREVEDYGDWGGPPITHVRMVARKR